VDKGDKEDKEDKGEIIENFTALIAESPLLLGVG
jgi:hypothetical protein